MSKSPQEYYTHNELPEGSIRLIRICPTLWSSNAKEKGNPVPYPIEDQLEIVLETFKLSDCPAYTALSYTWGPSGSLIDPKLSAFTTVERVYPIFCTSAILLATWNLRSALRRIRHSFDVYADKLNTPGEDAGGMEKAFGGAQYVWVDALCINQNDLVERSHQVKLMSQLYGQASKTFVWLGEKDEYSYDALAAMDQILERLRDAKREAAARPGSKVPVRSVYLDANGKRAAVALLSRNWFQRYWIIQEVVLSKEIWALIGSTLFTFNVFERARTLKQLTSFQVANMTETEADATSQNSHMHASYNIHTLSFMERARTTILSGRLLDFINVKLECHAQKCSDPRDRIYSLLAICSEFYHDGRLILQPDYTKPVEAVFLEATSIVVKRRADLAILSLVHRTRTTQNLPSWCPDYVEAPVNSLSEMSRPARFTGVPASIYQSFGPYLRAFGQCVGFVSESCRLREFDSFSMSSQEWSSTGPAAVCSLLSRVGSRAHSEAPKLQQNTRVELLWRTLLGLFQNTWSAIASWEDEALPTGVALFLPQFLRMFLFYHLARLDVDTTKLREAFPEDATQYKEVPEISQEDITRYGQAFETALTTITTTEPESIAFLPKPGQCADICRNYTPGVMSTVSLQMAMSLGEADMEGMQDLAKRLGLNLPLSFTSSSQVKVVDNAVSQFLNQTCKRAGNWWMAFSSNMLRLAHAIVFRTDTHLFGLTKSLIKDGDEVWILDGAFSPICLRRLPNGNYHFVGELKMHGMMENEAAPLCKDPVSITIE